MIVGVDLRLNVDEAHALVWALGHLALVADSKVVNVPLDVKYALPSALDKALESVIVGIQWVGGHHPLEPIDADGNAAPLPSTSDLSPTQPQTLEVPFRE